LPPTDSRSRIAPNRSACRTAPVYERDPSRPIAKLARNHLKCAWMSAILDEIASQPDIWRRSVTFLPEVSNRLPPDGVRAALIGCGTSYYVARAVASAREAAGFGESDAFVASEMLGGRWYDIVVALSRSGTTTEVVRALESLPAGCRSVAICAVPDTPVVE